MSDRTALIDRFLAGTRFAGWHRTDLPVDASRRSYQRLVGPDQNSAILMDAPPDTGEDVRPFLRIGAHLRDLGLGAPQVYAADERAGLLVLQDLGPDHFAGHLIRHPEDENRFYLGATDAIVTYTSAPPPDDLITLTPNVASDMIGLFTEWCVKAPAGAAAALRLEMAAAYERLVPEERYLSLRDFHAENLIWRGHAKAVGLLDFQDAFLAPQSYDLMSLLRDPRRDVAEATVEACLNRLAQATGRDRAALDAECACVAAQRNLRILGIFHRLIRRDSKPKYAAFLPRVAAHLDRDLAHPSLAGLRQAVAACREGQA